MFTKTAEYYDALYQFKDYRAACKKLHQIIQENNPGAKSILDIACGTGKHLEILKELYTTEGLDLNKDILEVARKRCPDVLFHEADMTDFQLSRKFDVVICLFSSIAYVQTLENLFRAITCMANHLNPNGLLVIEPWITPENYWTDKLTANFSDQPNLKISWMYISRRKGLTSVLDIQYMVGTPAGVETFSEKHILGLWTDKEYKQAILNGGINPIFDTQGLFGRGMYYGIKS